MRFLYLDESGDLGFDFTNKKPSRFFTITILAINGQESHNALLKAVKKTWKRKLSSKTTHELHGSSMLSREKRYFFNQVEQLQFGLYALTVDKKRIASRLPPEKSRLYNYISRLVLDQIPFENAKGRVYFYIDKSKGALGIREFNEYVAANLMGRLDLTIPLEIFHNHSNQTPGLQAVDVFCNSIFRKYEREDTEFYEMFKEKIRYDRTYQK